MARKVDPARLDHAVQLYLAGKSIEQSAALSGVSEPPISKELHRRGIKPTSGRPSPKRINPPHEVIERYLAGESVLALSLATGVWRTAISRYLAENGVQLRGRQAAGQNRAARMTPEQRAAQASAAHEASRGRTVTPEERRRSARGRELNPQPMSPHEAAFAAALDSAYVTYRREVAEGPYNIDFVVGPVAVEILGGHWHAYKACHAERTPYLFDRGWPVAFVWSTPTHPLTAQAAGQVIAYADEARRDPARAGQYRVVRGDGHILARGTREDYERAGITPSRSGLTPSEAGRLGCKIRWERHKRA